MITKMININKVIEKLSYTRHLEGGDNTKERYRHMQWLSDTNAIKEIKPDNAIIVPDGATNGDIIKAMFPDFKVNEELKATRHFELRTSCVEITGIATSDWWNEPYKIEVEG